MRPITLLTKVVFHRCARKRAPERNKTIIRIQFKLVVHDSVKLIVKKRICKYLCAKYFSCKRVRLIGHSSIFYFRQFSHVSLLHIIRLLFISGPTESTGNSLVIMCTYIDICMCSHT